jgi:hypothetical protein
MSRNEANTRKELIDFTIAKAQYLFNRTTESGVGGDKRKFWRDVMGFESPEAIRAAILAQISRLVATASRTE